MAAQLRNSNVSAGNTSVRTILATVFVVWPGYAARSDGSSIRLDLSRSAERASALANATNWCCSTYTVRQQRTDLQTAFQAPGDFVKAVQDTRRRRRNAYERASPPRSGTRHRRQGLLGNVRDRWNTLVGRSRELEECARLKERDVRVLDPWYKAMFRFAR